MLRYDPIGRLIKRFKVTPAMAFWACIIFVGGFEHILAPWLANYPNPFEQGPKFLSLRIQGYANAFLIVPTIWGMYVWSMNACQDLMNSLLDNGVVTNKGRNQLLKAVTQYERLCGSKVAAILVWVGALGSMLSVFYMWYFVYDPWFGRENWGHFIFTIFAVYLLYYFIFWFAVRELIFIPWYFMLFKKIGKGIVVRISHPDHAGGLRVVGVHASRIGLLVLVLGFGFVVVRITTIYYQATESVWNTIQVVGWIAYILVVPLSMAFLIQPAHKSMKSYKEKKLSNLSDQIEKEIRHLERGMSKDDHQLLETSKRLKALRSTYAYLDSKIPVWPFGGGVFRQLTVTSLLPVLSFITSIVIDLLK